MKKLLSLLATVSLVSTATASVVACGNGKNSPIDKDGNGNGDDNDKANQDQNISTIISVTDLGDIDFYSLTGSDSETQNVMSEKIKNLNPNVGNAQINISNINPKNGTAVISVQEYTGTVIVSFRAITSINLLITDTDLGDINFYSLTGSDLQTETEIINQIRTLNSNVDNEQINISNINLVKGTATISVLGFSESLTITFTPLHAIEPIPPISFPTSVLSTIQLQDGTILAAGGTNVTTSFLASVDLSNPTSPQTQILAQGSTAFPGTIGPMIELQDGTILVTGGVMNATSFLASIDLSNPTSPQIQILAQEYVFPGAPRSIIELQDGTILVAGGTTPTNAFLASVDLSDPANPQIQILARGLAAFPAIPQSMIQLQDGTILIAGGVTEADAFLATVSLSNFQIQTLVQDSVAFPSILQSMVELQDGIIIVVGGNATDGSDAFLASLDLSDSTNPQIQILAQGSNTAFPSVPRLIIELYNGTILVGGGTAEDGSDAFLGAI